MSEEASTTASTATTSSAAVPEPKKMSTRDAVIAIVIALVGCGAFFVAGRLSVAPATTPTGARPTPSGMPSGRIAPAPSPTAQVDGDPVPPLNSFPEVSFAQQGEDLIIKELFAELEIAGATYLDIGAHDPVRGSNTFLFYALGSKGVLVEPNPVYAAKLKAVRPRDIVIDKGVGIGTETTAKYYEFEGDGQLNTFSTDQVKKLEAVGMKPVKVVDMPLVDINEILASNFAKEPPSLLSVDTEGLDLAILKKVDFTKYRPPVIIAETAEVASNKVLTDIGAFLATKHYTARGGTFINTVFVADEQIARIKPAEHGAPPPADAGAVKK